MPAEPIQVRCPDCGAQLQVDPATGKVLGHEPAGKAAPSSGNPLGDLGSRVRQAEERGRTAADRFAAALEAERKHKQTLEEKFRKGQQKAGQEPPDRPDNPLDDRWR